ncbi:MAG: metallophosphoesterase [Planctomycetota bacterium]|jgi:predicted phosphodiesterase
MEASGKRWIAHSSRSDSFRLWNLSDLHFGARSCAESLIKRDIDKIANDDNAFFVLGGDIIDAISYADAKRFDPDCVAEWVKVKDLGELGMVAMRKVRDLLAPIAHKCVGACYGNHELQYQKHNQQDLHGWLCSELNIPALKYSAIFDLVFVRKSGFNKPKMFLKRPDLKGGNCESFRVFVHHGAGFATTPGGKLNRLIRMMNDFDADIYMMGHVHDKTARRQTTITADQTCRHLRERIQLGVVSGAYLTTYHHGETTYGEQRGYSPVTLGAAWVRIKPETRELTAEV